MSDAEKAAYRQGAVTMARMLGSHAMSVAGALEDAADDEDEDDGTCPECDVELVDGFGGKMCPKCRTPVPTSSTKQDGSID